MKYRYWIIGLGLALCLLFLVLTKKAGAPTSTQKTEQSQATAIKYLPLGDSYTIGQSVAQDQRWPNQLTAKLKADGLDIGIVANPSVTGYATQDLIDKELPLLESLKPNFVTVLIGVNDYVQDVPEVTFHHNLNIILDTVQKTIPKNRIVLVTIPDYGKTPAGAQFGDPATSASAIKSFNDIIVAEAKDRGLVSVDIYGISQGVTQDKSLTAGDGLHPSGKQYALWTDAIYTSIKQSGLFAQ